jgi:hypothetical protein
MVVLVAAILVVLLLCQLLLDCQCPVLECRHRRRLLHFRIPNHIHMELLLVDYQILRHRTEDLWMRFPIRMVRHWLRRLVLERQTSSNNNDCHRTGRHQRNK